MNVPSPTAADQWTIGQLLAWTSQYLAEAGVDEPRLSAELLLAHALEWTKIELYTRFDHMPGSAERAAFRELVYAAAQHQPIAYLTGQKEFYSLAFEVTQDVLIPRPETEALVEQTIAYCCKAQTAPVHFLDLGTGSGCIAIAVLSQVGTARAVGSDISEAALAVARRNAQRHQVADRLTLVQADGLHLPHDVMLAGAFDLIVSNPPYVAQDDLETLPENVRRHEPLVALSAGQDGLAFYRVLHDDGPRVLKAGASVLVEIAAGMADAVRQLMLTDGVFEHAGTWRDPSDPHDRVMQFALRA
ncbi:MAG: peptide chain release factor N(5)-glutamine methyltransferase [Planctomycetota bacterium]|jgi:release factor glutamine methyltransferase